MRSNINLVNPGNLVEVHSFPVVTICKVFDNARLYFELLVICVLYNLSNLGYRERLIKY